MMLTALIADDESIARQLLLTYCADIPYLRITAQASDGPQTVLQCIEHKPDLLFLDVQMPELNGFEVLKTLWPYHQPKVVFTTAYDSYAIRAFEVNAVDYLLKPFTEGRFREATERVTSRMQTQPSGDLIRLMERLAGERPGNSVTYLSRMLVKDGRRMRFVRLADVCCIHSDSNYITLQTEQQSHLIYDSLNALEQRLDPGTFVRINRSYLVNLDYVVELESHFNGEYHVRMRNGQTLKWTRFYRDNLKTFYGKQ